MAGADHVDGHGATLAPGFVDVHVHGGVGADVMDADPEGLRRLARFHAAHGTTALVATTWAASEDAVAAALSAVASVAGPVDGGATILGAHLEGPWINARRAGAQDRGHIRRPDLAEACRHLDTGVVGLVTLAPELAGSAEVVAECRRRGVTVAAGHTEATFEEMRAAVAAGVRHVTHTFNAMAAFGHREPGTVGAALSFPELGCELIADGVHVHPAAMALLGRVKGPEGVILVSDATRATGLPEGDVDLGPGATAGQRRVGHHGGGAVRLPDGTLAGSVLTLDAAVANFAAATGWGWEDLWRVSSANAAAAVGATGKGRLAPGYDADLVLVDGGGRVRLTVVEGRVVHREGV